MTRKEFKESGLLEMYVMGLCSDEERASVESLLARDPELKAEVQGLQSAFRKYLEAHAKVPPATLKEKVVKGITGQPTAGPGPAASKGGFRTPLWLTALTTLAAAVFLFLYLNAAMELQNTEQNLQNCQAARKELVDRNQAYALQNDFLQDPNTLHIHIRGTQLAPQALAVAYWNTEKQEAQLQFIDIPPPATGKAYQLWADVEGEMISMGVVDESAGFVEVPFIPNAESLNITLEEEGGAEHPNVEMLMLNGAI